MSDMVESKNIRKFDDKEVMALAQHLRENKDNKEEVTTIPLELSDEVGDIVKVVFEDDFHHSAWMTFCLLELKRLAEWETLRQQIIELWKSRGLEVLDIEVEPQNKESWKWTISAKEKEK